MAGGGVEAAMAGVQKDDPARVLLEEVRKLANEKFGAESEARALRTELELRDTQVRVLTQENEQALRALETCTEDARRCRADLDAFLVKMKKQVVKSRRKAMVGRELPWEAVGPLQRDLAQQLEAEREQHMEFARKVKVWEQYVALEKTLTTVEKRAESVSAVAQTRVPAALNTIPDARLAVKVEAIAALTAENQNLHEELRVVKADLEFQGAAHAVETAKAARRLAELSEVSQRNLITVQAKAAAEVAALKTRAQENAQCLLSTRRALEKELKRRLQKNKQSFQDEVRRRDTECTLREKMTQADKLNEVARLSAQHEKVMRGERAKHEAKLKQMRAQLEGAREAWIKEASAKHRSELDELNTMHEERHEHLRLEMSSQMTKLKATHEAELASSLDKVTDDAEEKLAKAVREHNEMLSQLERRWQETAADERLAFQHREQEIRVQMTALLEHTKEMHAETVRMLHADNAAAMQRTLQNHSEVLKAAHEEFAEALARQAGKMKSSIDHAASQAMEAAEKAWAGEKQQLERSWEARAASLADAHKAKLQHLEEERERGQIALVRERDEARTEVETLAGQLQKAREQLDVALKEAGDAKTRADQAISTSRAESSEQETLRAHSERLRLEKQHQEEISKLLADHERDLKRAKLEGERRAHTLRREVELAMQAHAIEQRAAQEERVVELREQLRIVEHAMQSQTERYQDEMERMKQSSEDQLAKAQQFYAATLEKHLGEGFEAITNKLAEEPRSPKFDLMADRLQGQHSELQNALGNCMQRIEALVQEDHAQLKEERHAQQSEALKLAESKLADLESDKAAMQRNFEAEINALTAQHREEVENLTSALAATASAQDLEARIETLEAALEEAYRSAQTALDEQASSSEAEARAAQEHADEKVQAGRREHATALPALRAEHAETLETALRGAETRLKEAHRSAVDRLRADHRAELQLVEQAHRDQTRVIESTWEKQVRDVELAQYKQNVAFQEERARLQESSAASRRQSLADLRASLGQDHEAAVRGLRAQHKQELEAQEKLHASALRVQQDEFHLALAQTKERNHAQLAALQRQLELAKQEHRIMVQEALHEQARKYETRIADFIRSEETGKAVKQTPSNSLQATASRSQRSLCSNSSSSSLSSKFPPSPATPPLQNEEVASPGAKGESTKARDAFKVAEFDDYEEYVDRETGDSFWLHKPTKSIHNSSPWDRAHALGFPDPCPGDAALRMRFCTQRETLLSQFCRLHVMKTKIQELEHVHEEKIFDHLQDCISKRSSASSVDDLVAESKLIEERAADGGFASAEKQLPKGIDEEEEKKDEHMGASSSDAAGEDSDSETETVEFSAASFHESKVAERPQTMTDATKVGTKALKAQSLQAEYRQKLAAERQFAFDILIARKEGDP